MESDTKVPDVIRKNNSIDMKITEKSWTCMYVDTPNLFASDTLNTGCKIVVVNQRKY